MGRLSMIETIDVGLLAARVERLERANGRLKSIFVGASIAAMAILGIGAKQQDSKPIAADVVASRFVVADTKGHVRAIFGLDPDRGFPAETLAGLGVGLQMYGVKGEKRVDLRTNSASTALSMSGDRGNLFLRFGMGFPPVLPAVTRPEDSDYSDGFNLRMRCDGGLPLDFSAGQSGSMIALGQGARSVDGRFRVWNGVRVQIPTGGVPAFYLSDDLGRLRLGLGAVKYKLADGSVESRPASSIVLMREDGTLSDRLPR